MSRHTCEQLEMLYDHKTEIGLLKQSNLDIQKDIDYFKKKQDQNTILLITSLVSGLLGLLGIIGIFIESYLNK